MKSKTASRDYLTARAPRDGTFIRTTTTTTIALGAAISLHLSFPCYKIFL
jgi:hypothetical protein